MKSPTLKNFIANTNRKKTLNHTRNRKHFDSIRKKRNGFSINLIPLLLLTINCSGKRLNHSFHDDDLIAKELNEFLKNAVSILNIKEISFINNRTSDDITDPVLH